jgi:hypothetical protein
MTQSPALTLLGENSSHCKAHELGKGRQGPQLPSNVSKEKINIQKLPANILQSLLRKAAKPNLIHFLFRKNEI